ncbi:MAG: DUF87 domain-containing protein [Treponema sp.]|nr:DUF87 domain-containing protein [Treponema sp.]
MKNNTIASKILSAVFFILGIFFSLSLVFSVFSSQPQSFSGALFISLGNLLTNSYGICSIFIPLFFFTVAALFFIGQITFKKCIYISFALIPFFTAVAIERFWKQNSHDYSQPIEIVKLSLTVLSTGLIMAIEFLLSGIIAERLFFKKKKDKPFSAKEFFESQDKTVAANSRKDSSVTDDDEQDEPEDKYHTTILSPAQEDYTQTKEYHSFDNVPLFQDFSDSERTRIDTFDPDYRDESEEILEHDDDDFQETAVESVESEESFEDNNFEESQDNNWQPEISEESSENDENQEPDDFIPEPQFDFPEEENLEDDQYAQDNEFQAENDSYKSHDYFEESDSQEETDSADENNFDDESFEFSQDDDFISQEEPESDEDGADSQEDDFAPQTDTPYSTEPVQVGSSVNDIFAQMDRDIRNRLSKNSSSPSSGEPVIDGSEEQKAASRPARKPKKYNVPIEGLLDEYADEKYWIIDEATNAASYQLKETLEEFKIAAEVTGIRKGPVVTMFEILPAPGVKLSKIVALQDNIALRLAASSVRIVAPIPGKRAVGIEIPNAKRAIVSFREMIEKQLPEYKKMAIPVVLGKDIQGEPQLLDIAKTPHLLIAGSTGSGKSVCVNSLILSILYNRRPDQVKLILIDPKVVELKLYNDIPHLLTPVITEPKKAFQALQYCLCEMERRYAMLDKMGVRDIINYNKRIEERQLLNEKLPYIVVIIDEFADLMATTGKELESTVARLAAMSRAVGIHLVLATQRPSIDVITGLIKANIPTRIAFMVASKMDSRVIIDQVGAEKLLGHGDMLYSSATDPFPVRIQGTFMNDQEVENVVEYVKQFGPPEYIDEDIFVPDEDDELAEPSLFGDGSDPLYDKALSIVLEAGKASASYIQRRLKVGYNRAARLVEEMEARGIVGPANGSKPRDIIHMP